MTESAPANDQDPFFKSLSTLRSLLRTSAQRSLKSHQTKRCDNNNDTRPIPTIHSGPDSELTKALEAAIQERIRREQMEKALEESTKRHSAAMAGMAVAAEQLETQRQQLALALQHKEEARLRDAQELLECREAWLLEKHDIEARLLIAERNLEELERQTQAEAMTWQQEKVELQQSLQKSAETAGNRGALYESRERETENLVLEVSQRQALATSTSLW
jgi:hypothetical protein